MTRKVTWVPPINFISEYPYIVRGVKRYKISLKCTVCNKIYTVSGRQSAIKKKTTLCKECSNRQPRTSEVKKRISEAIRKRYSNPVNRKITGDAMKGILSGKKHWNWKGGITPINQQDRNTTEYKEWRTSIFCRDNYTCKLCNKKGNELNAHHIKEWANFPEDRFDINNGVTLCESCHQLIHKFESIKNKLLG